MSHPVDFPVCLRLSGRHVLLVGGGNIAQARCEELLNAGAVLHVVAPEVTHRIASLAAEDRLVLSKREYHGGDVAGSSVVFVAVDDDVVSRQVAADARAANIWVNAADLVDSCDFTLPSVGRRGPIVLAVSTSGQAPALARVLRHQLMERVGPRHVQLAKLVGWLRLRLPRGSARMGLLKRVVNGEAGRLLMLGQRREALNAVRALLAGEDA